MTERILQGKVVKGEAVGRTIGFPTANLDLAHKPAIKHGVYAALVTLKQKNYLGLAYFGPRYIFGEHKENFEVFIFDFNEDIYGQKLTVKLLKFLREPQKVTSLDELKKLLQKDLKKLDDYVILVDIKDSPIGIELKAKAHQGEAKLHRAISVQLFNKNGELLLQKRSKYKNLFPLVWANTVCTDVRPYESYNQAAERRLKEEFGLAAELKPAFKFSYAAKWDNNLSEREIDQVYFGLAVSKPRPNPKEIAAWKYISLDEAKHQSRNFAPWFQKILKNIRSSDIVNP